MRHIALAAALAFAGSAQAGVVYNWETVDSKGALSELTGRIEITDDVWRAGSIDYQYQPNCAPPRCEEFPQDFADPDSPVLGFTFRNSAQSNVDYVSLNLRFRENTTDTWDGTHFTLEFADTLDGFLDTGSLSTGVKMDSAHGLWTISFFDSDKGPPCGD